MYNAHYGFSCSPFENNLDQRFLFFSAGHHEVIAALLFFVKERKGFALVCGDVGTGKTMIINHLLNRLPKSVHPMVISNPNAKYTDILCYIAKALEIADPGRSLLNLIDEVKLALIDQARRGERFVLIIDEAHLLAENSLEAVRLLSNIETQEHKLLQILLIGQNELSQKLSKPEMRQLRQRININRFLAPMNAQETVEYVDYRLKVAGSDFVSCFDADCGREIYKRTGGVPRAINRLCDSALLIGKTQGAGKVNRKMVKMADEALRSDILYTPAAGPGQWPARLWAAARLLALAAPYVILAILIGVLAYRGHLGTRAQQVIQAFVPAQTALPEISRAGPAAPGSHDAEAALKRYPPTKPAGAEPTPPPAPAAAVEAAPKTPVPPRAATAAPSSLTPAAPAGTATAAPPASAGTHTESAPAMD